MSKVSRDSLIKPWTRLGIKKEQYRKAKPWRNTGMSQAKYEKMILTLPQDLIDEFRRHADADLMMKEIFGEELASQLD